jgi:hypothetical protein
MEGKGGIAMLLGSKNYSVVVHARFVSVKLTKNDGT